MARTCTQAARAATPILRQLQSCGFSAKASCFVAREVSQWVHDPRPTFRHGRPAGVTDLLRRAYGVDCCFVHCALGGSCRYYIAILHWILETETGPPGRR